jgi:toxin YoeB
MRAIAFEPLAFSQYNDWAKESKQTHRRTMELLAMTARGPFTGIGKPEPLKHQYSGCWSRRIDDKHRIIYRVTDDMIIVLSCRDHYAE